MKDAVGAEFLRLVRPQWNRLHFVARRYAAGGEDARDLVQETLLRAWQCFSPAQDRTYQSAWLFVVMRSAATHWARTAKRRIRLVPVTCPRDGDTCFVSQRASCIASCGRREDLSESQAQARGLLTLHVRGKLAIRRLRSGLGLHGGSTSPVVVRTVAASNFDVQ